MKRSKILAALIIISISLLPLVPPQSYAAAGYSEKLTVYIAGSSAAWFVSVGAINVTNPLVQSAESIPGLNSYNLTAIEATSWTADFQAFGPQGYKVLPVPFVPPEGAFLTVSASSYADAGNAAAKFGSYLLTTFQSASNGTGSYSFFAPITFPTVVPATLLGLLPFSEGGFLAAISIPKFIGTASPMVTLSGQKTAGLGFAHQITIGSITSSGLDSTSRPNILNYFGQSVTVLQASNKSSSSTIELHFLDGLVVSSDGAKLTSDRTLFSSSYTLTLKPGVRVSKINASVIQQPPVLLATRQVDVGVLRHGSNMSVTISLTNLSNSSTLQSISVNDSWWKASGSFKLVRGSSDVSVPSLGAGQSTSPTYVLQYTGNATMQQNLPPTPVTFTYLVGTTAESGHANLNPMTISLGVDQPVVYAYLTPVGSLGSPVGSNQSLNVVLKNVGTRAASAVAVSGRQVGGLSADGGSATVAVSAGAPSFARVNVTRSYVVSYTTPAGQSMNLTTNSIQVVFSHRGMKVGFGVLTLNSTLSQLSGGSGYSLVLTLDFANKGSANLTSVAGKTALPAGLGCGKTSSNVTCSGNSLALSYASVKSGGKAHDSVSFNVTKQASFIFWPAAFSYLSSGYAIVGYSNARPAPTGLVLSKQFTPSDFFPGMASKVAVVAVNDGPYAIYNATVSSAADAFDSLKANQTTTKTVSTLGPGSNITLNYAVTATSASSNKAATPATAKFFMGGTPFTISVAPSNVRIDEPPSVTIAPSPTNPVEGTQFTVKVTISNPASVAVSDIRFLLPIPRGVKVSNPSNATLLSGDLSVTVNNLAPGASYIAQANVAADSGQTIPFRLATLTYSFGGQTLNGTRPSGGIAISENVSTRYVIPVGIALLALLVVAYEIRRMASASVPASPK